MYHERGSGIAGARVWTGTSESSTRRVLPDGCMDLLWMDGRLVVAGPDTVAFVADSRPGAVTTGLRLPPGAAPGVLGVPAAAFRNLRVRLDDVWPAADVARAEELVATAADPGRALEQVAAVFGRGAPTPDGLATEIVRRARAGEQVAAIAPALGLSARQLQRRANELFGYGPKLLVRILRLVDALEMARAGEPLATVAAIGGYADQAHLADDVRALTGATLGELGFGRRAGRPQAGEVTAGRVAKRSTELPSGSRTVA